MFAAPAVVKGRTMRLGIPSTPSHASQWMLHRTSSPWYSPQCPHLPLVLSRVRIITPPPSPPPLPRLLTPGSIKWLSWSWWEQMSAWFTQALVSDSKLINVLAMAEPPLEEFYSPIQRVCVLQAEECSSIAIPQRHLLRRVIQLSGLETCW